MISRGKDKLSHVPEINTNTVCQSTPYWGVNVCIEEIKAKECQVTNSLLLANIQVDNHVTLPDFKSY